MIKKEIITAVAIGLLISVLIAGGILRAKSVIQHRQANQTSPSPQSEATTTAKIQGKNPSQLFLKIDSPKNNAVVKDKQITLTGETLPHTYIAIITDSSEYLIVPNEVGQFSQQIKLIKGANLIKITVYTKTGEKVEKTLNLVYTEAEI